MSDQESNQEPASLGFGMPAEWAPHRATWLSWPHNLETWPGAFEPVEPSMVRLVAALALSEPVWINVLDEAHEAHVREWLDGIDGPISFHRIPTNDAWCRDHGATFVRRPEDGQIAALDFGYNAWGGKYPPFDLDAAVAGRMADLLGVRRFEAGMTLEGGALDVNGDGILLTTESCVLNPNRNPGLTRREAEQRLRGLLGVRHVVWVEGELDGDDTDGHIDNLARFVTPTDIVMSVADDPLDPHYQQLRKAFDRLARTVARHGITVHPLPLPEPVYRDRRRLPASHANFYIGNRAVIVPVFDERTGRQATERLREFFPDRRVIGIDCRDLVWGLGTVHCLTQQVPA